MTAPVSIVEGREFRPSSMRLLLPALLGWGALAVFTGWYHLIARPDPGLDAMGTMFVGLSFLAPFLIVSQVYAVTGVLQFPEARRLAVLLTNFSPAVLVLLVAVAG